MITYDKIIYQINGSQYFISHIIQLGSKTTYDKALMNQLDYIIK